ncbi:MAG: beta-ketoacyl synthase [Pseudomonadota bacterium]
MRQQPDLWLAQWFANTPPLHSLILLNSSSMAYLAEALACRGPMAGYCGQEGAGLDALLEASHNIAEGRADAALVVSTSPNITPALFLRETELEEGTTPLVPGEGAAACLLGVEPAKSDTRNVRIVGYSRGFLSPTPAQADARQADPFARVLNQVLSCEHLSMSDLSAVWSDPDDALLRRAIDNYPVRPGSRPVVGALGASSLLTDLAYALAAPEFAAPVQTNYLLLLNRSYTGHLGALLLAVEPARRAP